MEVLGLFGSAGSGKDLVADWCVEKKGFVKIAFADPMKRFVMKTFSIGVDVLWGSSDARNEEFPVNATWWLNSIGKSGDACRELIQEVVQEGQRTVAYLKLMDWLTDLRKTYSEKVSARIILQTLGTEWGRDIDDLMWVRYLYKTINKIEQGNEYTQVGGLLETEKYMKYNGAIIPDHRFKNEVVFSQEVGAHVIRLRRLSKEKAEDVGIAGHRSEADQKELPDSFFDHVCNFPEGVDKVYEQMEGVFEHKLWINTRGRL